MKQSCENPLSMEEIEVANIMLELPRLVFKSELCPRFSLTWGLRKKRFVSSKQVVVPATSPPSLEQSSSSLPPSLTPAVVVNPIFDGTTGPIEKTILSSSPYTPLSFYPSELEEKPQPSKKKPSVNTLKRKRDQFLEMVEDFTNRNELLKKDIEIKRQLLNQQITENLELKSKKIKLRQISMETKNATVITQNYDHQQQSILGRVDQQPLIMDQMVRMISLMPSETVGSSKVVRNVEPHGIIDLNISAIDLEIVTKRMAAQARLKRKQICRAKNLNAVSKKLVSI